MTTPTFATGVAKQVVIAVETTEGVNPVTGGKTLRRVSSDLALNKDSYESQEILVSQQLIDARHGVHRPQGTFSGQLSPGSFNDFWQGILRGTFTAGVAMSSVNLTLALGPPETLTISSGFLAAGIKQDDVVEITGAASPNTALNSYKFRVNVLSDTVITTRDLGGLTLTAGALTGVTLTVVGKKLFIPATGQIYNSYTIEHWFSDVALSEAFLGCKFGSTSFQLPPTGMATFSTQIMGIDMVEGTTRALTSPGPQSTTSAVAAVNGTLSYNGADLAAVTGLSFQINAALGADPVVGSDVVPHIFNGRLRVTGNMTVLFQDESVFNTFKNEVEVSSSVLLFDGGANSSDFIKITFPRLKLMSASKNDSDMSLVQSFGFTALENVANALYDYSTIVIQDSAA